MTTPRSGELLHAATSTHAVRVPLLAPVGVKSTPDGTSARSTLSSDPSRLQQAMELFVRKTRKNIQQLADEPKTAAHAEDGNYFTWNEGFFEIHNWTSSFFTGMALHAYRLTGDSHFLDQLARLEPFYRRKVQMHRMDTMHDLGFLYTLYSVGMFTVTGESHHRDTAILAADLLANRFNPRAGFIRAWGRLDDLHSPFAGVAIVDCMMNLPLLFWSARQTGNSLFHDIAVAHADSTLRHFVREDGSVCHAFSYDPLTGQPLGESNFCGSSVGSHWARGAAWAMYGFALAYHYTGDSRYLNASERILRKWLECLGADEVPVWDFKLPAHAPAIRDTSAAAIMTCGIQLLRTWLPANVALTEAASRFLSALCSESNLEAREEIPGVLKSGQIGRAGGGATNRFTSWGDYFLMEALVQQLTVGTSFW